MRIAVAVPPVEDFYLTPHRCSYMGARTVVDILEKGGHQTAFFGFPTLGKTKKQPLPQELYHLKDYLIEESGPLSWFTSRKRFGPHYRIAAEKLLNWCPQKVIISCFAWCYAEESLKLAEAVNDLSHGTVALIIGGAGVSANPEYFRGSGLFESVISGEAEKELGQVIPLSSSPPEIVPLWSMARENRDHYRISTLISRGCPKNCRFCSNFLSQGRKFRPLDQSTIENMLSDLPEDKPVILNFEDDNLLFQKEMFFSVLSHLRERYPDITFTAENGLDYTLLSVKDLLKLIDTGFRQFNFSAGTYNSDILHSERRENQLNHLTELANLSIKSGIPVILYFICGLPEDSPAITIANLKTAIFNKGLCGISLFYPVPGLPGFTDIEMFLQKGPPYLACGSSAYPWAGTLTTEEMITAFRLARLINLVKSRQSREEHKDILGSIFKTGKLFTYTKEGKKIPVPFMDKSIMEPVIEYLKENTTSL